MGNLDLSGGSNKTIGINNNFPHYGPLVFTKYIFNWTKCVYKRDI